MLPIEKIVKALRVTRTEFGNLFLQAQVDSPISDRKPFEAFTRKAVDAEAFAEALGCAQAEGWLDKLVVMIIDEGLEDGTLTQELAESAQDGSNATLQTIVDAARGFDSPYVMYRGIADGMKWTGKVLVAGVPKGTGILISPNLVLTAWHVVKELFRFGANGGGWEPDPGGGPRLEVVFDDFLVLVGQNRALRPSGPLRIGAHKNWCVAVGVMKYASAYLEEAMHGANLD